jgi:hypothetical protein
MMFSLENSSMYIKATLITNNNSQEDTTSQMVKKYNNDDQESWYRAIGIYYQFHLAKEEMMRRKLQDENLRAAKKLSSLRN